MRHRLIITLALMGLLAFGGSAFAQAPQEETETETGTIEARKAALDAAYEARLAEWKIATAEYIAAIRPQKTYIPLVETVEVSVAVAEDVEERLGFAMSYWNNGGCNVAGKALTGTYDREASSYDAHAMVRTAPSGGDCERQSTSFSVGLERRYEVGGSGWSAMAKFAADRRSTSAPYALVDAAGDVLTRPDGGPSDPVTLPAGAADTIGGYLGISSPLWRGVRITLAGNVVPVEWADEADGLAGHIAVSYDFGDVFDFDAHADVGRDWYGGARASWRPSMASRIGTEFSAGYSWGLNSVDGGEPDMQTFAGLPVVIQGAPRDDAWTLGLGITF